IRRRAFAWADWLRPATIGIILSDYDKSKLLIKGSSSTLAAFATSILRVLQDNRAEDSGSKFWSDLIGSLSRKQKSSVLVGSVGRDPRVARFTEKLLACVDHIEEQRGKHDDGSGIGYLLTTGNLEGADAREHLR